VVEDRSLAKTASARSHARKIDCNILAASMLTLQKPEEVAIEVIGAPIRLSLDQSAADVPGWDATNNTLIALDISHALGVELNGWDVAQCTTFGELIDFVNEKLSG
jgi:acyl carrier protein